MPATKTRVRKMVIGGLLATLLAGGRFVFAEDVGEQSEQKATVPKAVDDSRKADPDSVQWTATADIETRGWLPGSAAYSLDGTILVVGGTGGRVIAFDASSRHEKWKANVGGRFAAVAFASDGKSVLATVPDGVRFLAADTGNLAKSIEDDKDSHPTAVGVFPDMQDIAGVDQNLVAHKIIFGNASSYFVKSWFDTASVSTIETSTVAKGHLPADPNAVPLAVDPAGRSVIIRGPIHHDTGRNVLWAYVAGNYKEGSPGNRLLEGHQVAVVSAAWSQRGGTVASGDSGGRVIIRTAKTMQETRRLELGGRIAALALSADGSNIAAIVVGKQAELHIWKTAMPNGKRIHTESGDFSEPTQACLTFSPDGRQVVGSVMKTPSPANSDRLVGKIMLWEAGSPELKQKPPK